jgi:hypothetical protein
MVVQIPMEKIGILISLLEPNLSSLEAPLGFLKGYEIMFLFQQLT